MSTAVKLPPPPPEPAACTDLDDLAPLFCAQLLRLESRMRSRGWHITRRETLRSTERAAWLYGFGRTWDDGRGVVTNAADATHSWHHYGLAADYGDARYEPGNEPPHFWIDLRTEAVALRLVCGGDWRMKDRPHIQWGSPMRVTPSAHAEALFQLGGRAAVWRAVGAAL